MKNINDRTERMKLLLYFLFTAAFMYAAGSVGGKLDGLGKAEPEPVPEPEPVVIDTLDVMAEAFAVVESTQNPKAYNSSSGAAGYLQIKKIMVREANRLLNIENGTSGVCHFTYDDRWDRDKSKDMFKAVMRHRNKSMSLRRACRLWNRTHSERYYNDVAANYERLLAEAAAPQNTDYSNE